MSPTPRTAYVLALIAASALVLPPGAVAALALVVVAAVAVDTRAAARPPVAGRHVPAVLSRGVPSTLTLDAVAPGARGVRLRQAAPPDLRLHPPEADDRLSAELTPVRRGRHTLPRPAVRVEGPLGLARFDHHPAGEAEVLVYPDMPAARRLAVAVRQGRFREQGLTRRGPLGLGTEFESIRDYSTDDDIRQVNWRATARLGRPMSNEYRIEQDRDLICLVDAGRLMAGPTAGAVPSGAGATRLDSAVDAVTAVGLVADQGGDRCGAIAFDSEVRRLVRPRRKGGAAAVRALFDLEPRLVDADYELAFRTVAGAKRAFVLVLTDLLEETAARPLVEAMPVLARRHAVVVASIADPDVEDAVARRPAAPFDVYRTSAALEIMERRERAATMLRGAGVGVLEAPPHRLAAACVRAYLTAKARARL